MFRTVLKSKIHRARVTGTALEYVGSLSIDSHIMRQVGLREHEQILVGNITTGERFVTYAIEGAAGSREFCVNGAAAHRAKEGDLLVIMSFVLVTDEEVEDFMPSVITLEADNGAVKDAASP